MSGFIVRLRVSGRIRAVDYTRQGEEWSEAITRLYNRFISRDDSHLRHIARMMAIPSNGVGQCWRLQMEYETCGHLLPDPEIEAVIIRRSPDVVTQPDRQRKRWRL